MPKKSIRPIRVEGAIAYVPLTQGLEAIIDADAVHLVDKWNWFAWLCHGIMYAARGQSEGGKRKQIPMHRVIAETPDGLDTDHKDGVGLNNRRSNLRVATRSQNMHNKRMQCNNTSGFKGVHWNKGRRLWQANIKANDQRTYLGSFQTAEEASEAYWKAAQEMHLDFARLE